MPAKPKDFSTLQRQVILMMSATNGITTREINEALKTKSCVVLLDSLRNRGIAKASGHYSPVRAKWTLTDAGIEVQKAILKEN